jgi:hypothetical protein
VRSLSGEDCLRCRSKPRSLLEPPPSWAVASMPGRYTAFSWTDRWTGGMVYWRVGLLEEHQAGYIPHTNSILRTKELPRTTLLQTQCQPHT